jgi:anaerobic ribonucleoside-triphosphate reductase
MMVFNIILKEYIFLEVGEVWCPDCNGVGGVCLKFERNLLCAKCYGWGKLDWIENITGRIDNPEKIFNRRNREEQ